MSFSVAFLFPTLLSSRVGGLHATYLLMDTRGSGDLSFIFRAAAGSQCLSSSCINPQLHACLVYVTPPNTDSKNIVSTLHMFIFFCRRTAKVHLISF